MFTISAIVRGGVCVTLMGGLGLSSNAVSSCGEEEIKY